MTGATETLFAWKQEYSVNIREIDEQHKRLVLMVAHLQDAMISGQGKNALSQILDDLVNYTRIHFATEERLLRSHMFPGLEAHRTEHDALTRSVLALKTQFDGGQAVMTVRVMRFLKDWLINHIMGSDKQYAGYLHQRGVR